ncbi:NaeI family type II restriction endonuclease [Streptomyces sp. NBC_00452]|uniref:NaeI family type II restriction endonuclease n=1 Tax=Streptomyces sp. NBC_00452 TaxID=2975746 RepID=UPI002253D5AC|nr:NaeI family type II restriction endonuclease [Streptomyces sp. NBC_00452]MCX5058996.1 NaeI family type II restriction endonuclease [Streptomyces sp. NBC_00452]
MISRVTKVLAESGAELSHEELLDAIWLAGKLPRDCGPLARSAGVATATSERHDEPHRDKPTAPKTAEPAPEPTTATSTKKQSAHPVLASAQPSPSQEAQAPVGPPSAFAVSAPDSSTLGARQLRLGKSLRPLRQRFPDRGQQELDVTRTVAAIADTGVPETVTRAARTRWLSLALVVDDGVSMVLWQRLAADVRALMERAGAFRDVHVYGLDTRSGTPSLRTSPYHNRGRLLTPETLCDPTGNTLVLVVSDGVGEAWRDGGMRQVMDRWGSCGPAAIVQALPSRLWASTGIGTRRWQVTTHRRGGPTRAWHVTDPDLPPDLVRFNSVPVPVLAPTPAAVADWAWLVASPGGTSIVPLWDADRAGFSWTVADARGGDACEAVLRFREAASTEAYRLAAHVAAVAPVTPPVMRLVQAALGSPTDLGHLVEVFLGGLMHELDADGADRLPHHRRFDFTDDARRVLLSAVSPRELLRTTEAVTRRIEAAIGRAPIFPAWVGHPDGTAVIDDSARAFGWLREQTLTRLGIPSVNAGLVAPAPERPSGRLGGEIADSAGPKLSAVAASDQAYDVPGEPLPPGWVELLPEDPLRLGRFRLRARSALGWPHLTMYLAEDEDGTVATVRVPVVLHARDPGAALDLVRTEAECLTRMQGMHAPALLGVAANTTGELPWVAASCVHRRADAPSSPPAPNLRAVLDENGGTVPEEVFLRIGLGLTEAVALAHSRGLVHGSLSPRAVLVTDRDVRLVGWATATVDGVDSPHRDVLPLSDTYLEAANDGFLTPQSDVYAVGALLLAFLSGQWSDPKTDRAEHDPGPNSVIGPVLVRTLRRCLENDPSRRPSAAALAEAFAAECGRQTADRGSAGDFPVTMPGEDTAAGDRPGGKFLPPVSEETERKLPHGLRIPADESGTLVDGRYLLTQKRHAGVTSTTWQATDEQQSREVSLKLFNALMTGAASAEEDFIADAERLAALDIRGFVRVTGYGVHDRRPYLVTDAVNGEGLEQLLKRAPGTLPFDTIREVGQQIAHMLAEFHRNGLLHLDLSSAALVLSQDGRVLVTDPGLCVRRLPHTDLSTLRPTRSPSPFLPPYRSYEEIFGNAPVDHRSDLYSLGCLLYAMVTGAPPLPPTLTPQEPDTDRGPHRRPDLPSGFPGELEALVTDLLATNPEQRPTSATEVLDRLARTGVDDEELLATYRALRDADPDGTRMGRVLRDAIDEVLDGEVTGRYDLKHITKTERTHIGSLVHTAIQREFRFEDGQVMDFRIADFDVDCRFSLQFGGWMLPRGTLGHLCLLVWANDYQSQWSVGLLRVKQEWLNSKANRDLRTTLKAEHRDKILWLWRDAELAENVLLHISDADREAVFESSSGQARLNELFRRVQQRRIGRNIVRTVVQQRDYMKRVRGSGGSRSALRDEGIIVMGDYDSHRRVARQLGLPAPREGEFISARVAPAVPGAGKPVVELDSRLWALASSEDPVHRAPALP